MIWATVNSWSCFCWLYRASPSLAADKIMNLISVDHLVMSMCRVFSCVVVRGFLLLSVCYLGKTLLVFSCFIPYSKAKFACYSRCFSTSYFCIPVQITYFRDKRKWGCKNRMLSCTTHFSANPVEKWAKVEDSFGIERVHFLRGILVAQMNLPAMQGTRVWSLGQEDLLDKEMAIHFQYSCLENSTDRGA